jgi:hypothetical protein
MRVQYGGEILFKELIEVQQEIRYLTLTGKDLNEIRDRIIIDMNNGSGNLSESLKLIDQKLESLNCKYEKALFLESRLEKKLELIV